MEKIQVLDEGYVAFVEGWGSDESIIEAARMSTNKGFLGWGGDPCPICEGDGYSRKASLGDAPCEKCNGLGKSQGDERLLAYLYMNKHSTPFEMGGIVIEVKAPIFVFREWHRHRTQSYNEMSARYIALPDEHYVPTVERLMTGANTATTNKQAQGTGKKLTREEAEAWIEELNEVYRQAEYLYQVGLNMGVPKELARLPISVARYSRMRACANLRNWLAFLTLRQSPSAQWEIRQYANAVGTIISQRFPRTWDLYLRENTYVGK